MWKTGIRGNGNKNSKGIIRLAFSLPAFPRSRLKQYALQVF